MDSARQAWGLPAQRRVILFGALNAVSDRRKGYQLLRRAVALLAKSGWSERASLVVFGAEDGDGGDMGLDVRYLGHVTDDTKLAQLYAAADVMVVPSLQESFGKTLIEAMACGTPVVAFDSGGPADIVDHKRTGYLAHAFSADDLAAGVAWCLEGQDRAVALGLAARARVESRYSIDRVAGSYRSLYRRILEKSRCADAI
jgi:glycosyltransferase involved in cell wall biosynthesis